MRRFLREYRDFLVAHRRWLLYPAAILLLGLALGVLWNWNDLPMPFIYALY
jgi:hypothetical protein